MLYISPIYQIYRRDIEEADILFVICRDISDILNVSRHIQYVMTYCENIESMGNIESAGKKGQKSAREGVLKAAGHFFHSLFHF
jgi:hypothetical protein